MDKAQLIQELKPDDVHEMADGTFWLYWYHEGNTLGVWYTQFRDAEIVIWPTEGESLYDRCPYDDVAKQVALLQAGEDLGFLFVYDDD